MTRPVQAPAEEFHRSITEFLRDWSSQHSGGFEPVRVIGERWSARSQELRDLFSRHRIPAGFYDAPSARARQMLRELGLQSPELPVVVFRFGAERPALVNPSNAEIADAFGVMTPISPGEIFDVAVVGAGPAPGGRRRLGGRPGPSVPRSCTCARPRACRKRTATTGCACPTAAF
jgi:thioredoxin reductase (NADPH)